MMKTSNWNDETMNTTMNTTPNDYFVHEPAVTDHPEFWTTNVWCAATLHLFDIPFLGYDADGRGNQRGEGGCWVFSNTEPEPDAAWKLARSFRTAGEIVVPILEYQRAYRAMARAKSDELTRRGISYNGYYQR